MSTEQGSVLVACPTYAGKEYALDSYLAAYAALTYEPRDLYMVDNTGAGTGYFETLKARGVRCAHLFPYPDFEPTFRHAWRLIHEEAVRTGAYWVYSVEADNIVSPESLQIMVDIALYANIHLVTHTYPMHATAAEASGIPLDSFKYDEMGCLLVSTKLLGKALAEYDDYGSIPLAIFSSAQKWQGGRCTLTERFEVRHLDGYEMEFWQFNRPDPEKTFCPTPVTPADYGTVIPPSLLVPS